MKHERTYKFLEQFLKWNFGGLPSTMTNMLHGSPSVAMHMWLNLSKLRLDSTISIVLFDDPFYEDHKDSVEEFLSKPGHDISDIPAHFVISIEDEGYEVHFDSLGDVVEQDRRIRSIHYCEGEKLPRLLSQDRLPKALHGPMLQGLRTTMGKMREMYGSWKPTQAKWDKFRPYHQIVAPLGDMPSKHSRVHTKRTLRK